MAQVDNPESLVVDLYDRGFIKFNNTELNSGIQSPIYIDLHGFGSVDITSDLSPAKQIDIRERITDAYALQLEQFNGCDHIVGVPEGGLTIAGFVGYDSQRSVLQPRVKPKQHGQPVSLQGNFIPGQSVILIDDVISTGDSVLKTKAQVEQQGLRIPGVAVVVDREQGGRETLFQHGLRVEAAIGMSTLIAILASERKIEQTHAEMLQSYFAQYSAKPAS